MNLLTWNIRQGGGAERIDRIEQSIQSHAPDVVVLTEFQWKDRGRYLSEALGEAGWIHQIHSIERNRTNSVLVCSNSPVAKIANASNEVAGAARSRWVPVNLPRWDVNLLGVHVPCARSNIGKQDFWDRLLDFAKRHKDERWIIAGDFNTGLLADAQGTPFHCAQSMRELLDLGWIDAWRMRHGAENDYSWYSRCGHGFRLDYVFLTPQLANAVGRCEFSHKEREKKVSDHSPLMVMFDDLAR